MKGKSFMYENIFSKTMRMKNFIRKNFYWRKFFKAINAWKFKAQHFAKL